MQPIEIVTTPDSLRTPESALQPDVRSNWFAHLRVDGTSIPITLQDRHKVISGYELAMAVPLHVRVHFETAKNLYLYAWFVYRFFPIAEKQALTTLEFALREKLSALNEDKSKQSRSPRGLRKLFNLAVEEGLISNDGLRMNKAWAESQARERVSMEKQREMIALDLEAMEYDENDFEILPEDYSRDWMQVLSETLPSIRNSYAHGSAMLHPGVSATFEIVTDLVNQLYKEAA